MLNCSNQGQFYVEVTNYALLVMRFAIIHGREKQQTDNMLIGGTRRLFFPKGITIATILMQGLYPPGVWMDMYEYEMPVNKNYCYSVYGTFYLPSVISRPCTKSSNICIENDLQMQSQEIINCMYKSYLSSITQCKL